MIGYVYKIVYIGAELDEEVLPYIGSTKCSLTRRFAQHRDDFKKWNDGKKRSKVMVYDNFLKYGKENFRIIEVERCEVEDKQQLLMREQYWMENIRCCNKCNAIGRNKDNLKAYSKQYYETHKDEITIKKKEYNVQNKVNIAKTQKKYEHTEKAISYRKEYRQLNREASRIRSLKHYVNNKDKVEMNRISNIFNCHDCDSNFGNKSDLTRHYKSINHLKNTLPIGI